MNMSEKIDKLPKIDLHLHLDGSLVLNMIKDKYNLSDEEIAQKMIADEKCTNLNDYLTKFDFPISIMQTKEELHDITVDLLRKLKSQNVIYVEIRFAPQFHTSKGLTQEEVIQTVISAKNEVDIKSNLILCIMRGEDNEKENYETLELAKRYLGKGVCALDLAGAEGVYPTSQYSQIFKDAKNRNIPFTIHAGEAAGTESIRSAISFGAKRIGHGVRAIEDEQLVKYIIENNITLEVCPTSNIQTCICNTYSSHPLEKLYRMGVSTTINTDNMTVSNTTLANEYLKIIENTNLDLNDIIAMLFNSIDASFITDKEKEELRQYLKKYKEDIN